MASADRLPPANLPPFLQEIRLWREGVRSFEEFPYCLPVIRGLDALALHPLVTFLVGENGSGKSTLLEGIVTALGINPEGGSRNLQFSTFASHSNLGECLQLIRDNRRRPRDAYFLRAETFYNVATELEKLDNIDAGNAPRLIKSYGGQSLHSQSHGESFFSLFEHRFGGDGLYLLDEPEAALSPLRQMGFLKVLHDLVCAGSQFLIATHSPIILAYPHAWIYALEEGRLVRKAYRDTEHYRVTRSFLERPEQMTEQMLGEE